MSISPWGSSSTQFFYELTPDRVLDAVEEAGLHPTGRCYQLGSFENRVYELEMEWEGEGRPRSPSETKRIAKFYRPGRWSFDQIMEEHSFLAALKEQEIPAIAPLPFADGSTLKKESKTGIWYTLFPKVGGRSPDELTEEQLVRIGRLVARIHNVGAAQAAPNRVRLDPATYGRANLSFLREAQLLPAEYESEYTRLVEGLCDLAEPWFQQVKFQRIHGDCHFNNLLWNDEGPFFLDFDDMVTGPQIQDLWLLVPGRDAESLERRRILIEAYTQLRELDPAQFRLVEPLRALRIVHFSAWIGKRYQDPAFPKAFPEYGTLRYWQEEIAALRELMQYISS